MFSFESISRWLTFHLDPVSIEDWVANRELLGPIENPSEQDKELESAYQIEALRQKKISPAKEHSAEMLLSGAEMVGSKPLRDDVWLLAPAGVVNPKDKVMADLEVKENGGPTEKYKIAPLEIKVLVFDPEKTYRVKVSLKNKHKIENKSDVTIEISKCRKLIFDGRGRPLSSGHTKELLKQWKGALGDS